MVNIPIKNFVTTQQFFGQEQDLQDVRIYRISVNANQCIPSESGVFGLWSKVFVFFSEVRLYPLN